MMEPDAPPAPSVEVAAPAEVTSVTDPPATEPAVPAAATPHTASSDAVSVTTAPVAPPPASAPRPAHVPAPMPKITLIPQQPWRIENAGDDAVYYFRLPDVNSGHVRNKPDMLECHITLAPSRAAIREAMQAQAAEAAKSAMAASSSASAAASSSASTAAASSSIAASIPSSAPSSSSAGDLDELMCEEELPDDLMSVVTPASTVAAPSARPDLLPSASAFSSLGLSNRQAMCAVAVKYSARQPAKKSHIPVAISGLRVFAEEVPTNREVRLAAAAQIAHDLAIEMESKLREGKISLRNFGLAKQAALDDRNLLDRDVGKRYIELEDPPQTIVPAILPGQPSFLLPYPPPDPSPPVSPHQSAVSYVRRWPVKLRSGAVQEQVKTPAMYLPGVSEVLHVEYLPIDESNLSTATSAAQDDDQHLLVHINTIKGQQYLHFLSHQLYSFRIRNLPPSWEVRSVHLSMRTWENQLQHIQITTSRFYNFHAAGVRTVDANAVLPVSSGVAVLAAAASSKRRHKVSRRKRAAGGGSGGKNDAAAAVEGASAVAAGKSVFSTSSSTNTIPMEIIGEDVLHGGRKLLITGHGAIPEEESKSASSLLEHAAMAFFDASNPASPVALLERLCPLFTPGMSDLERDAIRKRKKPTIQDSIKAENDRKRMRASLAEALEAAAAVDSEMEEDEDDMD